MPDFLSNLALALIVAVVTAWATVQFSIRQFRTQKWWEVKAEAYRDILDNLQKAESNLRMFDENLGDGEFDKFISNIRRLEWHNAHESMFISDAAAKRLDRLREELNSNQNNSENQNIFIGASTLLASCRKDLIEIAKQDISF